MDEQVIQHTHDGINSKQLNLSFGYVQVMSDAPTADAQEGTLILQNNGSDTFKLFVRINKSWKSVTLT